MDDPILVLALAEYMRQLVPVCSILGGFALTAIVLERRGEPGTAHTLVVLLLMAAAVALIVAVCSAARYLYSLERIAVLAEGTFGRDLKDLIATGEPEGLFSKESIATFRVLVAMSGGFSLIGICSVLGAMAVSGFTSGQVTGWVSSLLAIAGLFLLWIVVTA